MHGTDDTEVCGNLCRYGAFCSVRASSVTKCCVSGICEENKLGEEDTIIEITVTAEKQEIQNKINELAVEIKKLAKEQELIEDIENRIPKIKENLQEMEQGEKTKNQNRERRDRI